jgi:hypothetical protein
MNTPYQEQNEKLTTARNDEPSVVVDSHIDQDKYTELRQRYEVVGVASLKEQLEVAYFNEDDDVAKELLELIQANENSRTEDI